jgi:putative tricarboxylic transport membrane protein
MDAPIARRPGEVVFATLMLLISLLLFWQAYKISGFTSKSSPGAFPLAATGVMVLAAVVALANTLAMPKADSSLTALRAQIIPNVVVAFSALIIAYGLFIESVGFLITSLVFLFGGILLLYQRGVGPALGWALASIIVVYVIFRLVFKVVLPEGIIPERRIIADIGAAISKVLGK